MKEISFPESHPQWAGTLPDAAAAACLDVDAVVFAGTVSNVPTNPIDLDILPADATAIHVSDDVREIGKNQRADVAILGHPGTVLDRLAGAVAEDLPEAERTARREAAAAFDPPTLPSPRADHTDPSRASNARLADAIATAAPDALVVAEASTSTGALRERFDFEPGQYLGQRGGGLGFGVPAAIGAAMAEEETGDPRDVLGFIGDGAYLFYPHALYTAARYGVDLGIVVVDNRNYRILKDNMVTLFGGSEGDYDFVGMDFDPPVDIPTNAKSHGATGRLVDDPDAIEGAIEEALAEDGPTVLDVLVHD